MTSFNVLLHTVDSVKDFVSITNDIPYDMDLVSGRYVVDAKSIMGIFSLDLAQPIELQIHSDESLDGIMEKFSRFLP